jgi:hypothetical protein
LDRFPPRTDSSCLLVRSDGLTLRLVLHKTELSHRRADLSIDKKIDGIDGQRLLFHELLSCVALESVPSHTTYYRYESQFITQFMNNIHRPTNIFTKSYARTSAVKSDSYRAIASS